MNNFTQLRKVYYSLLHIIGFIIILVRCSLTILLLHKYIVFSSVKEVKKGGTFVEAIYEPISYLPYWGDPEKNSFYQTILFPGCNEDGSSKFCEISSDDNQTYIIQVITGTTWSDGKPLQNDDVFFTYKSIVVDNKRNQPYLSQYNEIIIKTGDNNTIVVTFPTKSVQNKAFFSLPILPKHIVEDLDVGSYVKTFSTEPITAGCAKLKTSIDSNSLIIDLIYCDYSNINYYQIKSYGSYQEFFQATKTSNKNTVSLYQGSEQLSGYKSLPIINNMYMTIFFNTSSSNLSSRIQRSLGGLLYDNIIKETSLFELIPYTGLFSYHKTDGSSIAEILASKNPKLTYDSKDLEKAGVKALPEGTITILGTNIRQSYFFSKAENGRRSFSIATSGSISSLRAKVERPNGSLAVKSTNNNTNHTISFTVGNNKQIQEGINTITIVGNEGGKEKTILTVDIYYLGDQGSDARANTLKAIYYNNTISDQIMGIIKKTLQDNGIESKFEIEGFSDINSFATAINTKSYDIVVTPLSMTDPIDIAAIISNEDTQKNPSSYKNIKLAKLLEDYSSNPSSSKRASISEIFSTDMPFIVIGQITTPYWIKEDINLNYKDQILLQDLKKTILSQANIVSHMNIRGGKLLEKTTFLQFIESQKTK